MTRRAPTLALPLTLATSITLAAAPSAASEPDEAPASATADARTTAGAPTTADAPTTAPSVRTPAEQAEFDRVVGHGRRLKLTGGIFTMIGLGAAIGSGIVGAQGNLGLTIGLSAKALVTTSIGGILLVAGRRRLRQPERFMRARNLALGISPQLSSSFRGATVSMRF